MKKDYGITSKISKLSQKLSQTAEKDKENNIISEIKNLTNELENKSDENISKEIKSLFKNFNLDISLNNINQSTNSLEIFESFFQSKEDFLSKISDITKNILNSTKDNSDILVLIEHSDLLNSIRLLENIIISYIKEINRIKNISTEFLGKLQEIITNANYELDSEDIIKEMYRIVSLIYKSYNNSIQYITIYSELINVKVSILETLQKAVQGNKSLKLKEEELNLKKDFISGVSSNSYLMEKFAEINKIADNKLEINNIKNASVEILNNENSENNNDNENDNKNKENKKERISVDSISWVDTSYNPDRIEKLKNNYKKELDK